MYTCSDYFDLKKKKKPYELPSDDLKDHLCALDMLIEAFMFFKADMREDGSFHARGIEISEEEMGRYFKDPPSQRAAERRSVEVSRELKKAFEHIRSREEATLKAGGEAPLRSIADEFNLSLGEILIITMAASLRYDLKYLRIYRFISDTNEGNTLNAGVCDALLNFALPLSKAALEQYLDPEAKLCRYIINCSGNVYTSSRLLQSITIGDLQYRYLLMGKKVLYSRRFTDVDGDFFKEFAEGIVRAAENDGNSGVHLRYVECADKADVEYALSSAAGMLDKPLYVTASEEFYDMDANARQKLIFCMRMDPGIILLVHPAISGDDERYKRKLKCGYEYTLKYLTALLGRGIIYVCGDGGRIHADTDPEMSMGLLKLPLPDTAQRIRMWHYCLNREAVKVAEGIDIDDIADCHALSFSAIRRLCVQARESLAASGEELLGRDMLQELLFKLDTSDFEHLATEVKAQYTWDDIYIEESQLKRLKAACDRYRLRGRIGDKWGINKKNAYGNAVILLMYGPPGTGKTMAAQAIANEVMTPLYRVDVSQIFSKYIGETQKNLSRIFDEASRRNVVLFFDEADALFTRRTEIKDSHDKYANSDTSFLLQKVEEYNGISILATNNFQSFDPAFMRRLSYVVRFERPDEDTRRSMWEHMLPDEVPRMADIDYDFLASRFKELSGSNIKSVLLTSAYLAGAAGRSLCMRDIILAIRYEYEKLGRLIDSDEFGQYAIYMQE